ncbi:response regulator [Pseudomonas sp. NA-150]|uniref:response regulator n=1 Tax=Pseudomonas sp. NA-150 TaxID=3367525 RepID=UPI0037C685EB
MFRNGQAIRLGSRAFDILELLIKAQGRMVSKDALLKAVWPDTVVEENNLQVHISALRKVLGTEREIIKTVPGRGYRLLIEAESLPACAPLPAVVQSPIADPAVGLIGREPLLVEAMAALATGRVLTLLGPGGVGKTALARALAARLQGQDALNICFVSLEKLQCEELLVEAIACALGVDCLAEATAEQSIAARLKDHRWLIVLDNCEHLIESVSRLCEHILQCCASVSILATSREAMRISVEDTLCVGGLELPLKCYGPELIARISAVRLFLERAGALGKAYRQDPEQLQQVAELCCRLDGWPLALEMAATRVSFLGLAQTLAQLDAGVHLLTASSRTAAPRHQALSASLELSDQLLEPVQRQVLRQMAGLPASFSFADACQVGAASGLSVEALIDCISGLINTSWLNLCQTHDCYWISSIARSYLLARSETMTVAVTKPEATTACSRPILWEPDLLLSGRSATASAFSSDESPRPPSQVLKGDSFDTESGVVYIVDDEPSVRVALDRLLRSAGFSSRSFASADEFLAEPASSQPACLLLDVNLASASGLELQAELRRRGSQIPIIFMTGYGTIPLSVKAMKAGAHEFLTKPFDDEQLLESIRQALRQDQHALGARVKIADLRTRFETLTPRERQVLPLLIEGKRNRQVALELGTREITTKVHKKHVMTKMGAGSLLELVKMCELLGMVSSVEKHANP